MNHETGSTSGRDHRRLLRSNAARERQNHPPLGGRRTSVLIPTVCGFMLSGHGKLPRSFYQSHKRQNTEFSVPSLSIVRLGSSAGGLLVQAAYQDDLLGRMGQWSSFCRSCMQCLRKYAVRQRARLRRCLQEGHLDGHKANKGRAESHTGRCN